VDNLTQNQKFLSADVLLNRILECEHAQHLREKTISQMKFQDLEVHLDYTKGIFDSFPWEMQFMIVSRVCRHHLETALTNLPTEGGEPNPENIGDLFTEFASSLVLPDSTAKCTGFQGLESTLFTVLRHLMRRANEALEDESGDGLEFDVDSLMADAGKVDPIHSAAEARARARG